MSPSNAMNFTALLLVTQSLQATPTAVASLSQPAIEMVHQVADGKPSTSTSTSTSSEPSSRSSSLARFRLRRKRTTSSLTSQVKEDAAELGDNSETCPTCPSSEDDSDSCDYYSPDSFRQESYRGRSMTRTSTQSGLHRMNAKLSKRVDPRDFMKTGIPQYQPQDEYYAPFQHHHHHHHHHHYHQAQQPQF